MVSDVVYYTPVEPGAGTAIFPDVDANARSLEDQADVQIREISESLDSLAQDSRIKVQILALQDYVDSESVSPEEVAKRIELSVVVITRYFFDVHRSRFIFIEQVYPGFTERFLRDFRFHAECLVTTVRRLLEFGDRIQAISKSVRDALFETLGASRVAFNHQKWEGAYNRRGFDHYRAQALHAASRRQASLQTKRGNEEANKPVYFSQLKLDLDKFKRVNDLYGEAAGDQVLQAFLNILRGTIREIDILGMTGGDEYLVFLSDTDQEGALILAERVRNKFEHFTFKITNLDGFEVALDGLEERPKIGVSIGVATLSLEPTAERESRSISSALGEFAEQLERQSELAMHGAKVLDKPANGGNSGTSRKNAIMTFDDAEPRRDKINNLLVVKSDRRDGS